MYDKSHLSPDKIAKQKSKGTYDSPCMSICDYELTTNQCQTCGLLKSEKQEWKTGSAQIKAVISSAVSGRLGEIDDKE